MKYAGITAIIHINSLEPVEAALKNSNIAEVVISYAKGYGDYKNFLIKNGSQSKPEWNYSLNIPKRITLCSPSWTPHIPGLRLMALLPFCRWRRFIGSKTGHPWKYNNSEAECAISAGGLLLALHENASWPMAAAIQCVSSIFDLNQLRAHWNVIYINIETLKEMNVNTKIRIHLHWVACAVLLALLIGTSSLALADNTPATANTTRNPASYNTMGSSMMGTGAADSNMMSSSTYGSNTMGPNAMHAGPMGPGMMGESGWNMMGMGMMGPGMMSGCGGVMMGDYGYGPGMMNGGYTAGNLGLSSQQRKQMADIWNRTMTKAWPILGQLREQYFNLAQLFNAENPDRKAIDATYAQITALQKQLLDIHFEAHQKFKSVLTAEQRKQLQ